MNRRFKFVGIMVIVLSMVLISSGKSQEQKKGAKQMPSQEEMMKKWQEAMTPGDAHKKLEAFVGTWDAEAKSWMNGPTGEPAVSKGVSEYTSKLGGRYVQESFTG